MTIQPFGEGVVMPPGSLAPAAALPPHYEVTVHGLDESGLVRCVYPGGFVKHHQAETVSELAGKVVSQLRGRYGAGEVAFARVPDEIKAGQSFTVGG